MWKSFKCCTLTSTPWHASWQCSPCGWLFSLQSSNCNSDFEIIDGSMALHLFLRPLSVVGWDCSQDWLRFWNSDIKPYQEVYVISIWHWKFSCNRYCWGFLLCRELWLPHFCLIHNAHSSFKLANCGEVFWTRNREIYYFTELGSNFLFRFNDFLEVSSFLFVEGLALLLLKASAMRILWRI